MSRRSILTEQLTKEICEILRGAVPLCTVWGSRCLTMVERRWSSEIDIARDKN
jgi:hypothetical protein